MSKPSEIISGLKSQFEGDSNLSYVKNVYYEKRESVSIYPCIMLDVVSNEESDLTYPMQDNYLTVEIIGYIEVKNRDKSLIGDSNVRSKLDFENDIKKAISADPTIGGYAIHTEIMRTDFVNITVPVYMIRIEARINYTQNSQTRS